MGGTGGVADASDRTEWLRQSGFFREVSGYAEAVDLLNDRRLHAQFVRMVEALGVTSGPLWEAVAASLLSLNGEEHRRLRSVVAPRFTPRAVESLRPFARDCAHELIETFAATGQSELVAEFAAPYVMRSTCRYVGFPEENVADCWDAVELVASAAQDLSNRVDDWGRGVLALVATGRSVLEERRRDPRDDVLTVIADAVDRGSLPELIGVEIVGTLLSAGHEPTINQLGILVSVLSGQPEVWDALGRGELAPGGVVEEVFRLRSTNQGVARWVAESFDYRGAHFKEGETILVSLDAVNHDPRQFEQADQMDLDAAGSHLAFGFGPHFCLGAALARLQLQEAIRALTRSLTVPAIIEVTENEGGGLVGPSSLSIAFSRRPEV